MDVLVGEIVGLSACFQSVMEASYAMLRSFFIRIPRHPEENRWLLIYSRYHAYTQYDCVFDYPVSLPVRIFSWNTV